MVARFGVCSGWLTDLNCMLGKQGNITKIPHRPLSVWLWVHSYIENMDSHTVDEGTIASKVQELFVTQNTRRAFPIHLSWMVSQKIEEIKNDLYVYNNNRLNTVLTGRKGNISGVPIRFNRKTNADSKVLPLNKFLLFCG